MKEIKLVVVIMGQDCMRFLPMCLDAVKSADAIVYCDGGSTDDSLFYAHKFCMDNNVEKHLVIHKEYDQKDPQMNGKQRNYYLQHLKDNYKGYWALCLDADEIVHDLSEIKTYVESLIEVTKEYPHKMPEMFDVKMRHLIGDLGHEDATKKTHFVLRRLFKVTDDLSYPLQEHPVLTTSDPKIFVGRTDCTTIWHLAYCSGMWDIKKRYENHVKKSKIHSSEFLRSWNKAHLFGSYPKTKLNPVELPEQLLDEFSIQRDELYFEGRGIEAKHWMDAVHWRDFFGCKNAIEFGCGLAPRVYALNNVGVDCKGVEISKWAVDNSFQVDKVCVGDVTKPTTPPVKFDLAIAYDLLEHVEEKELVNAITNLKNHSAKHILVSVPMIGDPNLHNDPTHKIFQKRDWWVEQFTKQGLELIETPVHFLYKHQLLIFTIRRK